MENSWGKKYLMTILQEKSLDYVKKQDKNIYMDADHDETKKVKTGKTVTYKGAKLKLGIVQECWQEILIIVFIEQEIAKA